MNCEKLYELYVYDTPVRQYYDARDDVKDFNKLNGVEWEASQKYSDALLWLIVILINMTVWN